MGISVEIKFMNDYLRLLVILENRTLFHDEYALLRAAEKAREKKKKGQVTTSSGLPSYKSGR